jgi:hypothetical protein
VQQHAALGDGFVGSLPRVAQGPSRSPTRSANTPHPLLLFRKDTGHDPLPVQAVVISRFAS